MKLRAIALTNYRSFLGTERLELPKDLTITIGPNGGGKTNLLDAIVVVVRQFLLQSWSPEKAPAPENPERVVLRPLTTLPSHFTAKHSSALDQPQKIEVTLEVTPTDISNMAAMKATAADLISRTSKDIGGHSLAEAVNWDLSTLGPGSTFTYTIVDRELQTKPEPGAVVFRSYLHHFEVYTRLRAHLGEAALSTPMLTLPVGRSVTGLVGTVSLHDHDEHSHKHSVDSATSQGGGSILSLALGRLATRYRGLLEEDNGNAKSSFYSDPQLILLTNALRELGYEWHLECVNRLTNQYDIRLQKQGVAFSLKAASSGEKELLTYLFGIYALNVRDAVVVVDEPELHLHPRWQTKIISLFKELARTTGNQFLLATHSPACVSPDTLQYVARVYSENQVSKIVSLDPNQLPTAKHLFAIATSHNNERMFFAEKVLLVEGVGDRALFQAVLLHERVTGVQSGAIEIVSVGGKSNFDKYAQVLDAAKVRFCLVADLDYINERGGADIKALFTVNTRAIGKDIVDNPTSMDGDQLLAALEEAASTGDTAKLRAVLEYVKGRRRKLKPTLTTGEQQLLEEFIKKEKASGRFILSRGAIETYLPAQLSTKNIDALLSFIEADFWPKLLPATQAEFSELAVWVSSF
jgi:putative ATP-dependent endonuclease of OLD family